MMNFVPQQKSKEELLILEQEFWNLYSNAPAQESMLSVMHRYFSKSNPEQDRQYYTSYFQWYTELTWKKLSLFSVDEISEVALGRQFFVAVMLDIDVVEKILRYLSRTLTYKEAQQRYGLMRQALLNSKAHVGTVGGKSYMVKDIFLEMQRRVDSNEVSYKRAELFTLVERMAADWEKHQLSKRPFPVLQPTEFVQSFVEQMAFFQDTTFEDIPDILLHFESDDWFAEEEQVTSKLQSGSSPSQPIFTQEKPQQPPALTFETAIAALLTQDLSQIDQLVPQLQASEAQQSFIAALKAQTNLQDQNHVSAVFQGLAELANKGVDMQHALYFDEESGAFVWEDETEAGSLPAQG